MKQYAQRIGLLLALSLAVGGLWWERRANGQGVEPKQIVDQFFPESLINEDSVARRSCFQVYDMLPDGRPQTIMAGYSDGFAAAIRVIQAQGTGSYGILFEPTDLNLAGFDCGVELIDLNGDNSNEVRISFPSSRGVNTADWVFRWDGQKLVSLTPVRRNLDGSLSSNFVSIEFLDLLHDGTLQVRSVGEYPPPTDGSPPVADKIYRLTASGYVPDKPVLFVAQFTREQGTPQTETTHFPLSQDSTGPYVLRLANGDSKGQHRVASARVVLNGVEVLSPNQFSQQVEFLEVLVPLAHQNKLEVTLAGEPLGFVVITVEDTAAVQRARQSSSQP